MGARWAWTAVCPNLHIYSNFSGGADPCYECHEDPEVEFSGDEDASTLAADYVEKRKTMTQDEIIDENEVGLLHSLADKHGYRVERKEG